MTLGEDVYYYVLNVQGNVMGLVDGSGTLMITYYYEGYGKCFYLSDTSDKTATMSANNHLLYRSYLLDKGTGLYYLQSRYYDPARGRFLNADTYTATGQGLLGNNMFAYCGNNPVMFEDSTGMFFSNIFRKIAQAVVSAVKTCYKAVSYSNYKHNATVDSNSSTTTKNRVINDQNGTTGSNFRYGLHDASWNACETIAVHNANVLSNRESSLSETMKEFQRNGAMIGDGYFGSNPLAIGKVLDSQGVYNERIGLDEMTGIGIYIISFWNDGAPWNGLHTVAVSYDGTTYTTYNLNGNGKTSNLNPAEYANNFICGYYLGANL